MKLSCKIKANHPCIALATNTVKTFSDTITVNLYHSRTIQGKLYVYFKLKEKRYKIDRGGLLHSFKKGDLINVLFKGKKEKAKIIAQLAPYSNGIPGLSYLVRLTTHPSNDVLKTSEKWVSLV